MVVETVSEMEATAAMSAGEVQPATSHVKISVTWYSICQGDACNSRDDNNYLCWLPHAEVISAVQSSSSEFVPWGLVSVQTKISIVAMVAATNAES